MNVVISQTRFLSVIVNNLMLSALRVSFSNAMTNHLAWTYEPNYVPSMKLLYRSYEFKVLVCTNFWSDIGFESCIWTGFKIVSIVKSNKLIYN